jgi:regulatory protein
MVQWQTFRNMGTRANPKKLNGEQLWEYALRVLGQRAHSENELRQKLMRRAERAPEVDSTLAKLKEYGLTDDRKFSEAFAAARLENQGFGSFRVLRELRAKRVAPATAAEAIAKTYEATSESELIAAFLRRKYRNQNLQEFLREQKNVASVYRRLRTAGFSNSGSIAALKRYTNAVEEWGDTPEEENLREL